jgi:hypothetical protein
MVVPRHATNGCSKLVHHALHEEARGPDVEGVSVGAQLLQQAGKRITDRLNSGFKRTPAAVEAVPPHTSAA